MSVNMVPCFLIAAIFVILEKIHGARDLWYFSRVPVSHEYSPCTQDEGCIHLLVISAL